MKYLPFVTSHLCLQHLYRRRRRIAYLRLREPRLDSVKIDVGLFFLSSLVGMYEFAEKCSEGFFKSRYFINYLFLLYLSKKKKLLVLFVFFLTSYTFLYDNAKQYCTLHTVYCGPWTE